jgi:nucleoside-diphosphate-sugar epimerase
MNADTPSRPPPSGQQPIAAISGAGGYLGSLLTTAFELAGFTIRRLVRNPLPGDSDRFFDLGSDLTPDALDGVDVLVHCAYDMRKITRTDIWDTNVFGTAALFDAAATCGVRRTIAVSSMSAYAGTRQLYGRAKLETEAAALGRGMVVIRPGLVYGPAWGGMAGTLRRLATLPVLPDFGVEARQFTVREDEFASAVVALALTDSPPDRPVGIAHPESVRFTRLLTAFSDHAEGRPRFLPVPPMAAYGALRAAELLSLKLPVRADSLLGLIRPAPSVPNLEALSSLGITLQPFSEALVTGDGSGKLPQSERVGDRPSR